MIKKKFIFNPITGKLDSTLDPNSISPGGAYVNTGVNNVAV